MTGVSAVLSKTVLDRAKSFLCWDVYPGLSIKLIELEQPVGFFYPPEKELSTILLFYYVDCQDFTESVFLLFHEAGHYQQYLDYRRDHNSAKFTELMNLDKGKQRLDFERDAWDRAKALLDDFIRKYEIRVDNFPDVFVDYANKSISSYK